MRLDQSLAIMDLQVMYNSKLNKFVNNLFIYQLIFVQFIFYVKGLYNKLCFNYKRITHKFEFMYQLDYLLIKSQRDL